MAVFIHIHRSQSYRWAAVIPRSNWRSWPLSREIHTSRTRLGIAWGRRRFYSHTFASTMLLSIGMKKNEQVLEATPTKQQLYGHLPSITKTIKARWTRHAGLCWRSRDALISDVLLWTHSYGRVKAGRPARTYIQQLCKDTDVALRTCQKRWTIGRSGERGSWISVLAARHDDDDDEKDKGSHNFTNSIRLKVNVIASLDFGLAY